jgi:hypothetical protein
MLVPPLILIRSHETICLRGTNGRSFVSTGSTNQTM